MNDVRKLGRDILAIRAEPEIIDDLLYVLEKLLSLSKAMKNRARIIRAELNSQDTEMERKRQATFNAKAATIYDEYMKLQNAGSSRSEAVKVLVNRLGWQYYDVELFISQGRRLHKLHRDANIVEAAQAGRDLSEIAALHGLSVRTIQRVIEAATNPLTHPA